MVGTASFAPLLLIYLTIQADLIEYDINTNLLTERFLAHSLSKGYKVIAVLQLIILMLYKCVLVLK